jgi:hypothetical protein
MEHSRLAHIFVETVEDLRRRSSLAATDYDLIQAAGLLRRLLMDGSPLGPLVCKEVGMRARFRWIGTYLTRPGYLSIWPSLDPELAAEALAALGAQSDLGKLPSLVSEGDHERLLAIDAFEKLADHGGSLSLGPSPSPRIKITLGQYIAQIANDEGGVHFGMAKPDRRHPVVSDALVSDQRQNLWILAAVGRVVVRGYEEVVARIVFSDPKYELFVDRSKNFSAAANSSQHTPVEPSPNAGN